MKRLMIILAGVLVAGYLATGLFQVAPGEWGLVRRFGHPQTELRGPGLHIGLPWGLDEVSRVAVDEQKQLVIGYVDEQGPEVSTAPEQGLGLAVTGDHQMVNVRVSVHYRIDRNRLVDYVLAGAGVEELLSRAAETTMTSAMAGEKMDQVILGRSVQLESKLRSKLAETIDRYRLGVIIDNVNLVYAQPPAELVDIFREVNRARSQRDVTMTEAQAGKNAALSQARQEAQRIKTQGQATARTLLSQARSEAHAFRSIVATFPTTEPAASSALLQMYLSEMQGILARMQVRTLSDQGMEQVVVVPLPGK